MAKAGTQERRDGVACPFCGLACDDLSVTADGLRVAVADKGCARAAASFAAAGPPSAPHIAGKEATLEAACARAAAILAESRMPLVAGLATDVAGAKAAMALAERIGAVVDHASSDAMFRNVLAMQDSGWVATTLAEVKNRADLLILAGTDAVSRFPRFFERWVWTKGSLAGLDPAAREIVYLGRGLDTRPGIAPDGRKPTVIECEADRLGEVFAALRAVYDGRTLQAREVAGVPLAALTALAARIRQARYGVVIWSAADLPGPHGELAVQAICGLVTDANEITRFSGLALGGSDNALGAGQVCTWQSGFPLRTSFAAGRPDYDPHLHSWGRLIESGEADAALWISAFAAEDVPFERELPVIALTAPGALFRRPPAVHIPVGIPGIDHAGHLIRTDAVASLRLSRLRETGLPRTADVLAAIAAALPAREGDHRC